MPVAWGGRLLDTWQRRHPQDRRGANLALLGHVAGIRAAWRAGVQADANDADIRAAAAAAARDMAQRLDAATLRESAGSEARADSWPARPVPRSVEDASRMIQLGRLLVALDVLERQGLGADLRRIAARGIGPALARVVCERWWRRVLRRLHAVAVEGTARALGLVHKRAGCYVSDDGAARRRGQVHRNAAALESVEAVNEHGQAYTLAELAAKGQANKSIRRHELMTRIAGFEVMARELGHAAYFVTVTCPSRMHAWRSRPGSTWATEPNPHHDGTTPDVAQRHLTGQWAKFRAAAERAGLAQYGFRIAEPNHDGTPHWHAMLFFPPVASRGRPAYRVMVRLLRRYFFWQASPEERGARRHRIKVERIDWNKGSAAGYVAKYVAKNIDGYRVEKDLFGNEAITASQRVEAWAATWRVRQFQQIGGAPVGVWRELRRLHPDAASAAPAIAAGIEAANVGSTADGAASEAVRQYTAAHGWASYLALQGGTRVRRADLRLSLLREQSGEVGRYGELMPPRAVGVQTLDVRAEHRPAVGIVPAMVVRRRVRVAVESERSTWVVVPMGAAAGVFVPLRLRPGASRGAESAAPWSPVNNCTRQHMEIAPGRMFGPDVERRAKVGRWAEWKSAQKTRRESPA